METRYLQPGFCFRSPRGADSGEDPPSPVWFELHQGAKGKREEENLMGWREVSQWLDFDDACWAEAAKTARDCLQAGINVPFGDVLVFACATRHGVELLGRDRHFAMIREAVQP